MNTTPLNSIVVPTADVSLNTHKITNLSPATSLTDAMNLSNSLRYQWSYATLSAAISSGFTSTYTLVLDSAVEPVTNGVSRYITYNSSTGLFTLLAGHSY